MVFKHCQHLSSHPQVNIKSKMDLAIGRVENSDQSPAICSLIIRDLNYKTSIPKVTGWVTVVLNGMRQIPNGNFTGMSSFHFHDFFLENTM